MGGISRFFPFVTFNVPQRRKIESPQDGLLYPWRLEVGLLKSKAQKPHMGTTPLLDIEKLAFAWKTGQKGKGLGPCLLEHVGPRALRLDRSRLQRSSWKVDREDRLFGASPQCGIQGPPKEAPGKAGNFTTGGRAHLQSEHPRLAYRGGDLPAPADVPAPKSPCPSSRDLRKGCLGGSGG